MYVSSAALRRSSEKGLCVVVRRRLLVRMSCQADLSLMYGGNGHSTPSERLVPGQGWEKGASILICTGTLGGFDSVHLIDE